ncbi:MAG: hypothetical protein Fur0042_19000 [Cyanophyceae cyanobacterium]
MDAFSPVPPPWTEAAVRGLGFRCPRCGEGPRAATSVWLNRRSPVITERYRRKWQEFYACACGAGWWAWSDERPPSDLLKERDESGGDRGDDRDPDADPDAGLGPEPGEW